MSNPLFFFQHEFQCSIFPIQRRFSGWALSSEDWTAQLETFGEALAKSGKGDEIIGLYDSFAVVGYDDMEVPADQRTNEIWKFVDDPTEDYAGYNDLEEAATCKVLENREVSWSSPI